MRKLKNLLPSLSVLFIFAFILTFAPGNFVYAEESTYGHISYVDKEATVIREDHTEHKAVVNLPVAPGDHVVTGDKGRCELQFDNGTIIRLDKNTRLKVTTVLAPSLTSRWKVTTLHLLEGQIYTIVQSYNREMFQVITPNAAFDLRRRSSASIQVKDNGDTFVFVDRGKFKVMYGEDTDSLQTAKLSSRNGYTITAAHRMQTGGEMRDIDFKGWNDYITRNFKDLHFGISKVPKKIVRNSGLMYWAEKWGSAFGEWVYDELFGYVWRPYDEYFAYSARPFFHADFVEVNGKCIIVPQQPWGWVPAHMGTWVWTKSGWTWIPGEAFHTGVASLTFLPYAFYTPWDRYSIENYYCYPTFGTWIHRIYGGYHLYYIYRNYGLRFWQNAYEKTYKKAVKKPSLKNVPPSVRNVIAKMNKTPVKIIKERLGTTRLPLHDMKKLKPILESKSPVRRGSPVKAGSSSTIRVKSKSPVKTGVPVTAGKRTAAHPGWASQEKRLLKGRVGGPGGPVKSISSAGNFRDWNPDIHWGIRTGNNVRYSSRNNEVVCPRLSVTSRTISTLQKRSISGFGSYRSARGYVGGGSGSSSSSGSSSGSSTTSSSGSYSSRSGGGGASKGGGGGGGAGKSKQ